MSSLAEYATKKGIIVCCGAGGVGKTTTSAALALAAARAGRRVLVLTIDPSRRLAQSLGISRNHPEPLPLPADRQEAAGIKGDGSLAAWMLDPKLVSDRVVNRLTSSPEEAARLIANPIYQQVTRMIAGMQEYTAMEALDQFVREGRYDLVVLDTPPSRNALNFLEAPSRLASFLDGRIFKLFLPASSQSIRGRTRMLIGRILGAIFGEELFHDLQTFFASFGGIFKILNGHAKRMRAALKKPNVAFLLITSPGNAALEEAFYFERKIKELGLPLGGFVLNRSHAPHENKQLPELSMLPDSELNRRALEKLMVLAEREKARVAADLALVEQLSARSAGQTPVLISPELAGGVNDLESLTELAAWMLDHQPAAPPGSSAA